jgi:Holliday junction DNA helicase RuvA
MYNSISGIFNGTKESLVYLETQGIEWELHCSTSTQGSLPPLGEQARLLAYLHHNDTVHQLFGFASEEERSLFLELIKVSGIGPKAALKILSGMRLPQLRAYLEAGDADALATIPGLGKKTAQKLILALKGRLSLDSDGSGGGAGPDQDMIQSLVQMGFDKKSVEKTLGTLRQENPSGSESEEWLFREAIVRLSR